MRLGGSGIARLRGLGNGNDFHSEGAVVEADHRELGGSNRKRIGVSEEWDGRDRESRMKGMSVKEL